MNCRREDVLNEFIQSEALKEKSTLNEDEIKDVSFSIKTPDVLIEVLKTLIRSYSAGNTEIMIHREMNTTIKKMVKNDN